LEALERDKVTEREKIRLAEEAERDRVRALECEDRKIKQERERAEFKQKLELSLKLAQEQKRNALLELKLKEEVERLKAKALEATPSLPGRDVNDISFNVENAADTHTAPIPNLRVEKNKFGVVEIEEEVSMTPTLDDTVLRRPQVSITNASVNSTVHSPGRDANTARPDVCLCQTETSKQTTSQYTCTHTDN